MMKNRCSIFQIWPRIWKRFILLYHLSSCFVQHVTCCMSKHGPSNLINDISSPSANNADHINFQIHVPTSIKMWVTISNSPLPEFVVTPKLLFTVELHDHFKADVKRPQNFRKRLRIGLGNRRSVYHQRILDEIWMDKSKINAIEIARKSFSASQEMTHVIKKLHEKLVAENVSKSHHFSLRKRNISLKFSK